MAEFINAGIDENNIENKIIKIIEKNGEFSVDRASVDSLVMIYMSRYSKDESYFNNLKETEVFEEYQNPFQIF